MNRYILYCIGCWFILTSCSDMEYDSPHHDCIRIVNGVSIQEVYNQNHSAFTTMTLYNGDKLLGFREAVRHKPYKVDEYGKIKILIQKKNSDR